MQQYFIDDILKVEDSVKLPKDVLHHFVNVLRMKNNTEFYLVDKNKAKYLCQLLDDMAKVISKVDGVFEMPIKVTIVQALLKSDKFEYLIMKATELGVYEIIPCLSTRVITKTNDKTYKKIERYNKIAFEAACQCKRNYVPKILEPINLKEINKHKSELNFVCYEDLDYVSTKLRNEIKKGVESITIVIGPEGGFELKEIEYLQNEGFKCLNLGQRILRAETASLYALSVVSGLCE